MNSVEKHLDSHIQKRKRGGGKHLQIEIHTTKELIVIRIVMMTGCWILSKQTSGVCTCFFSFIPLLIFLFVFEVMARLWVSLNPDSVCEPAATVEQVQRDPSPNLRA